MSEQTEIPAVDHVEVMADIVSSYVSNNCVQPAEIPTLIATVHAALVGLGQPQAGEPAGPEKLSAAQVRKSITPDAIFSFIDGKPYKAMKRHLKLHGLDPASYRERYGLPQDYPINAPNYSAARSALAHSFGLGRKRDDEANTNTPTDDKHAPTEPKRGGRLAKAGEAPVATPKVRGRRKVAEQA